MLERLRVLESAATPAPWYAKDGDVWTDGPSDWQPRREILEDFFCCEGDALLVAAARNALPALLDIAEAAQALTDADWSGTDYDIEVDAGRWDVLLAALARLDGRAPLGGDA